MVSKILSLSRWGGPLSAYFELTADVQADREEAMDRGRMLEESTLALWAEAHGGQWRPGEKVVADSLPHAHASVDAFGWEGESAWPEPAVILDGKTVAFEVMGPDWGPDGTDVLPAEYHLQGLWYLGVCKASWTLVPDTMVFPTLCGPEAELRWAARLVQKQGRPLALADLEGTGLEFRTYRVHWDEPLFRWMYEAVERFIHKHVEPRLPPPAGENDLAERDLKAIARGLPASRGEVLDFDKLTPEKQAILADVAEAARQRRAWERAEEQAIARAQLLLGGTEEVHGMPGGVRVTWRATKKGIRRFEIREPRK